MANESRRISQLLITTTVSANDRVVVLTDPITNAQSKTVTFNNLTKALSGANSSTKGLVRIGNNVDIDANSTISVQLGTWSFSNSIAYTGDEQNSYIDGKTPAGLKLYNDTKINLNANSANWVFDGTSNSLILPIGGDIVDSDFNSVINLTVADIDVNSTMSVNSTNYQTNSTMLSLSKKVQKLGTDDLDQPHNYYLPDGYEGQLMYVTTKNCDFAEGNILIWMDNLRLPSGVVISNSYWGFNSGGWSRSLGLTLFTDGAWNVDGGGWGP